MSDRQDFDQDQRLASLLAHVARQDSADATDPEHQPADSTVKELKTELDSLADKLRQPASLDPYQSESALERGLSLVEAIGRDPTFRGAGAPESFPEEDLGTLREYRLLCKLGQGGMGTVYKALHTKLDKIVALKVLPSDKLRDQHAVTRFEREMKAVGRLEHPNIVRATDAGEIGGQHFLVMEHVDGLDLSTVVHSTGPLAVADACEVIRQAAVGLQHADEHGLVHRDIKPSNLMLTKTGQVKILDMGLALLEEHRLAEQRDLTTTGQMMGTLDYMAPEQGADSHEVDIRADIYALGATLFKLLCGEAPFAGGQFKTPMQVMVAIASEPAPSLAEKRPGLPAELVAVVDRMLQKRPDERFATAQEVVAALEPFVSDSDLMGLLRRAERKENADSDESLGRTDEYLSSPSTETEADIKQPVRGIGDRTHRLEKTQLARTVPRAVAWYRRPAFIAAIALGVFGILAAALIIRIMTDKGELIVKSEDDNVQVTVKRHTGEPVEDIELVKGENKTTLRSGEYEVVITGDNADQFTITPNIVTLSRGIEKVVTIERIDQAPAGTMTMPEKVASVSASSTPQSKHIEFTPAPLSELAAGEPLGPTALVARPAKIDGVRSWTIETKGHREEVQNIVSYDEESLIAYGGDGTVRQWDANTRELKRMILTNVSYYYGGPARVPNGRLLISGGEGIIGGPISVWDATTFQLVRRHGGPGFAYSSWSIQFSSDERLFGCHSTDARQFVVRRSDSGEVIRRSKLSGSSASQFSPDGKWLASGSTDVVTALHSLDANHRDRELVDSEATPGVPTTVWWSADSKLLAVARPTYFRKPTQIIVWDITTGQIVYRSEDVFEAGVEVTWKQGTHELLACAQEGIQLVDVDTGATKWKWKAEPGYRYSCRVSPDGSQVAVGNKLLAMSSGKLLQTFSGATSGLTWSPDGRTLAGPYSGGTVAFWRTSASGHLFQIRGFKAAMPLWSKDGSKPASDGIWCDAVHFVNRGIVWCEDRSTCVATLPLQSIHFDDERPESERTVKLGGAAWRSVSSSPTGDRVVAVDDANAGGDANRINVWDVTTKEIVHTLREQGIQVFQSLWSDDGKTIVVKDQNGITAWDAETGVEQFSTPISYMAGFDINPASDKIANVEGTSIAIRSLKDGSILDRIDVPEVANKTLRSIVWLDDNQTVAVAGRGGILRFIDTNSMSVVHFIEGVSPEGGFNDDGSIYTWELTPHSARSLEVATGRMETITWLRDDNWLIVTEDGHYRGSPQVDRMLVYAVETDDGNQHVLSPDEFAAKFGWKNDPEQVRVLR